MNQHIRSLILILILSCFCTSLYAGSISFKASTMTGNTGENRRSTTLSGNAWIQTDDMEISADVIELSGEEYDSVIASGTVSGTNTTSGFTFSCSNLEYNRKTGIVKLQGDVSLNDTENGVTATARFMEYNQNTETALMQIGVTLHQKESVCTCALALYRKKDQILEMSGSPQVQRGKDVFKAQEITFNLTTEEIVLDGRVRGTVQDDKKTSQGESDE